MKSDLARWLLLGVLSSASLPAWAQEEADPAPAEAQMPAGAEGAAEEGQPALPPIDWQVGPGSGSLGKIGEVKVPEGFRFAGGDDTRTLMRVMGNPVDGSELGFLAPDDLGWFIVFEFDDIGYVKDDDKEDLDAVKILSSIKEGNNYANEERRKNNWPEVQIIGWQQPPHYDPVTKNLEWAVRGSSEGQEITNYNTRILGRKGVMKANLVVDPAQLDAALPLFKNVLTGYGFKQGETYAEFHEGDKLAEYGLVGLVAGGAAAVAAKTGILAKLGKGIWKLLIVVGVAFAGLFKKIFGSKRIEDPTAPPPSAGV
ncbi:MAG: DUF2167 domain-containing protein [Deltaproteobacteria bacterium]|nr:DUF2167 domain-containing protein [Deltaproteobacteria bacterium]